MDKTSRKILKSLKDKSGYNFFWTDISFPNEFSDNEDDFYNSVKYLCSKGLLEYISTDKGIHIGIHLTHEGVHRLEFALERFWLYIALPYLFGLISGVIVPVLAEILGHYIRLLCGIQ